MDLTHQGNAVIHGDAKAYRMVVIDENGNEIMDISDEIMVLKERVEALENPG
jgi:hypothetical protein